MKPTPREAKLIHEKYDKVVKHLIDEKYAVNKESADKIISAEIILSADSLFTAYFSSIKCFTTLSYFS